MKRCALEIGGLGVSLAGPAGRETLPPFWGAIADFSSETPDVTHLSLDLCSEAAFATQTGQVWETVFGSGGVWRLLKSGEQTERLEVFNQEDGTRRLWLYAQYDLEAGKGFLAVAPNTYGLGTQKNPMVYPLDELLWIQLLRKYRGFILHAFGAVWADGAYCFAGHSGAGKTTLSQLFASRTGKPALILSDDRVILRGQEGGFQAYGTPWHGDGRFWSSATKPLRGIFFLEQSKGAGHHLEKIQGSAGLTRLLACSFPTLYHHQGMDATLGVMTELCQEVPLYRLTFEPTPDVFDFLDQELTLGGLQ